MNTRYYSYQILVYLTLHILAVYFITLSSASTKEWKFERETFCNVTISPYEMNWSQTKIQCGIRCAKNDSCRGFVFSVSTGCKFYGSSIKNETTCAENVPGAVQVYVRKKYCQHGGYLDKNNKCFCVNSYVGEFCERYMQDCSEGQTSKFYTKNDVYTIHPILAPAPFQVYCELQSGLGGMRIQANGYFSQAITNFNRTWQEYKDGFGNITGDHWLGNQKINWITNSRPYSMTVFLYNKTSQVRTIKLKNFVMKGEDADFAVTYSSVMAVKDLGSCWPNTSIKFSTYDRDNDLSANNCAANYGVGFWFPYTDCAPCNPNGVINKNSDVRLNISSENFWTPGMGNLSPKWTLLGLHAL